MTAKAVTAPASPHDRDDDERDQRRTRLPGKSVRLRLGVRVRATAGAGSDGLPPPRVTAQPRREARLPHRARAPAPEALPPVAHSVARAQATQCARESAEDWRTQAVIQPPPLPTTLPNTRTLIWGAGLSSGQDEAAPRAVALDAASCDRPTSAVVASVSLFDALSILICAGWLSHDGAFPRERFACLNSSVVREPKGLRATHRVLAGRSEALLPSPQDSAGALSAVALFLEGGQ